MNDDYWARVRQRRQLQELENVASELQRQRHTQQHQANLAQVLLDAESVLKALRELAVHDRFGAGLKARATLRETNHVRTESFHEYEMKRAWSALTEGLNQLWLAVESDPSLGPRAHAVVAASGALEQWRAIVGADPDARVRDLDAQIVNKKNGRKNGKLLGIMSLALMLLACAGFVMAAILGSVVEIPKEADEFFTLLMIIVLLVAPLVGLVAAIQYSSTSSISMAEENASNFRVHLAQFGVFQTRPDGGQLLTETARNHPILNELIHPGIRF